MTVRLDPPLVPRNGHTLEIILVARVSDPRPGKQDERSLDDQDFGLQNWIAPRVNYPVNNTLVAGSGSGEYLERAEYLKLIALVETGRYDAVISEDGGRVVRRIHAHLFCELCVDLGTRCIFINDHVDTGVSGWQDCSIFSAWHHERSNRDTSDRIKRTHRSRFMQGGCLPCEIFGYVKPSGAKTDAHMIKLESAERIYRIWFDMLDQGASFAEVADWLNVEGVPLPPHARNSEWDGKMVQRHTYNAILKGERQRNNRKSKRRSNGKYVTVKADPEDQLQRFVPHLAFFDVAYCDRVVADVKRGNAKCARAKDGEVDPLLHRPKKRTRWPGSHMRCRVCGRPMVFGAHGTTDGLMCSGVREWKCWNTTQVNATLAADRLIKAAMSEVAALPGFDEALTAKLAERLESGLAHRREEITALSRQRSALERKIDNLNKEIEDYGPTRSAHERRLQLEADPAAMNAELLNASCTT